MQSRDAIRLIKERLNIVEVVRRYVALKRNGPRWMAPCPFHQETKPSFSVNEEEGLFYCFGCQASGDLFDFYGRINGLDFRESLEQLAAEAGVTLDRGRGDGTVAQAGKQEGSRRRQMLRMNELAAAHFVANLADSAGAECREYIARRGLSEEIVRHFGLGWSRRDWQSLATVLHRAGFDAAAAMEAGLLGKSERTGRAYDRFRGRLMFPIKSLSNQIVAFGGRIIADEEEAKYINSADTPLYKKGNHLYGLAQARRSIATQGNALLTEGYMDVLTLHQFGYTNAVGVLGTALTPEQVKRLAGFSSRLTLLFDGDGAGRKAALRAAEMLLVRGLSCRVVLQPEGEDIDSLLRTQGKAFFEELCSTAPEGLQFCIEALRNMAPRDAISWARDFLQKVELQELLSPYITRLASGLGLSEQELRNSAAMYSARMATLRGAVPRRRLSPHAVLDRQILMFAVRYPRRMEDLRRYGADMALHSELARQLWEKLERFSPEEILSQLNEREKYFWTQCRTGEAPPLDSGDRELESLVKALEAFDFATQQSSLSAALRENAGKGDFNADLDYLRVMQETMGRVHEQS